MPEGRRRRLGDRRFARCQRADECLEPVRGDHFAPRLAGQLFEIAQVGRRRAELGRVRIERPPGRRTATWFSFAVDQFGAGPVATALPAPDDRFVEARFAQRRLGGLFERRSVRLHDLNRHAGVVAWLKILVAGADFQPEQG